MSTKNSSLFPVGWIIPGRLYSLKGHNHRGYTWNLFKHRTLTADNITIKNLEVTFRVPRRLSGRASDSGARGPGFEPHERRVVSLRKTL